MPGIIEVLDVKSALHVFPDLQVTVCDESTYCQTSRLQECQTPLESSYLHVVAKLHPRLVTLSTKNNAKLSMFAKGTKKC